MRAYVGVTDQRWYRFLAERPEVTEVNFWQPNDTRRRSLVVGSPFLFKTHHPHNRIVGGGFFSGAPGAGLTIAEAWEHFGEGNGAASLDDLCAVLGAYGASRPQDAYGPGARRIGCLLLRDVHFFSPDDSLPSPDDFAKNIVQGKGYELSEVGLDHPVQLAYLRLLGWRAELITPDGPSVVPGPVFGEPRLTERRVGQRAFKALVLSGYGRRCAVTGDRIQPVLEAAHIRPVADGGGNRVDNGLLLRSDVHTLFDRGYLTIDTHHRLRVSPALRTTWGNGEEFYRRAGSAITVPERRADRPSREFVEWHNDEVFQAS